MVNVVMVCGYGKIRTKGMNEYVRFAFETALVEDADILCFSGGDTADKANGKWKTEAEMMGKIAQEIVAENPLTRTIMDFWIENEAYNTLSNELFCKNLIGENFEKIVIVCNKAHILKVVLAAIRVFGIKTTKRKLVFRTFSLTKRKSENIKILLKTIGETIGYFARPIGRRIEYWQWRIRTGRKEKLGFYKFCAEQISEGKLI